jgi:hypothetical protein
VNSHINVLDHVHRVSCQHIFSFSLVSNKQTGLLDREFLSHCQDFFRHSRLKAVPDARDIRLTTPTLGPGIQTSPFLQATTTVDERSIFAPFAISVTNDKSLGN